MPAGVLVPGKWALTVVAEQCDATCGDMLYRIRQVRTLLKGDSSRVTRVLLTRSTTTPLPAAAKDSAQGLTQVSLDTAVATALATALAKAAGTSGVRLYLTDPLGNLVLHYPANFENPGLQKDLKKLLGLSSIG